MLWSHLWTISAHERKAHIFPCCEWDKTLKASKTKNDLFLVNTLMKGVLQCSFQGNVIANQARQLIELIQKMKVLLLVSNWRLRRKCGNVIYHHWVGVWGDLFQKVAWNDNSGIWGLTLETHIEKLSLSAWKQRWNNKKKKLFAYSQII